MNLQKALEVLQSMNSVCTVCNGRGTVINEGNILPCETCKSKGYRSFKELLNEVEEAREPKKTRKKFKK